ncbi:hypothetical protein K1X76_06325 [bacterium]|nr:hypothetical protein [bacterium]
MKTKKIASALSCLGLLFSVACGSSGSGSGTTGASISDIGDLPRATSAVTEAISGSLGRSIQPDFAESGKVLSEVDDSSFDSDSSMAMCLTTQGVKQSLKNMSFADMVLCYMQSSMENEANSGVTADLYDGNAHTFAVTFLNAPEGEGPGEDFVVKMQVTKSGDVITDFKMWSCTAGNQTDYINYNNGTSLSITTKSAWDDEHGTGNQVATITGELNDSLEFTSKSMVTQYVSNSVDNDGEGFGETTFDQGPDTATIASSEDGSFSSGEDTETYSNHTYAIAELLNDDAMTTIAIGDGAAKYSMSGTHGGDDYEDSGTESWNGDTTAVVDSNDFLADVTDVTLPDSITQEDAATNAAFTGDEVFDCDSTGAEEFIIDFEAESVTECNNINSVDSNYIDCWSAVQPS